jgi:hypothetical protein
LGRISSQKTAQDAWHAWLAVRLSGDLMARISGVAERDGVLTVFTESAAWCARIRYVLEEARAVEPDIPVIKVRVMPRGTAGG